jgi:hypothetical protein
MGGGQGDGVYHLRLIRPPTATELAGMMAIASRKPKTCKLGTKEGVKVIRIKHPLPSFFVSFGKGGGELGKKSREKL